MAALNLAGKLRGDGPGEGVPYPPPAWDGAGLAPLGTEHRLLLSREKAYLHLAEPITPVPRSSLSHSPLHSDTLSLLEDCPCRPSGPLLLVLRAEKGHTLSAPSAPFSHLLPASSLGFRKGPALGWAWGRYLTECWGLLSELGPIEGRGLVKAALPERPGLSSSSLPMENCG